MTNFSASMQTALDTINKPQWLLPLNQLATHFDGFPIDDVPIEDELLEMVWKLNDSYHTDSALPLNKFAAIRLSKLSCWTCRAYKRSGEKHLVWNPLTTPFKSFDEGHSSISIAASPHPAEDIIKRWCTDHLK